MDWNRVEGNWKQMKGKVKEQWGKLTDDDLDVINGKREQLEGKIQERYGYAKGLLAKNLQSKARRSGRAYRLFWNKNHDPEFCGKWIISSPISTRSNPRETAPPAKTEPLPVSCMFPVLRTA